MKFCKFHVKDEVFSAKHFASLFSNTTTLVLCTSWVCQRGDRVSTSGLGRVSTRTFSIETPTLVDNLWI